MRRGFTLVEILVALVLFQIAMLALTATTIVAARDLAAAHRRVRALAQAERRVALLRASACETTQSGGAAGHGIRESWSVFASGPARIVTDSVELTLSTGKESFVVRGWMYCPE